MKLLWSPAGQRLGAVLSVLDAIQGGFCRGQGQQVGSEGVPASGPPLAPRGSCQHQLSFLGSIPWCLQLQEVSGNSDSGWRLDCLGSCP